MEELASFRKSLISTNALQNLWGGVKRYSSFQTEGTTYDDVHHDNDNDGRWSVGDTYVLTKRAEK